MTSSIQAYAARPGMSVTSFSAILKLEEPLGVTLWESEAARELSDGKAGQIRPQVEQATGGRLRG